MKLVIVESPAKCNKIQGFLGSEFEVVASMGHIRALEESLDAVGLTTDFEPRFEFIKEKSKVQKDLKEAAKGKTVVYLAADDDREGEAIAYSVALLLKLPLATTPRIVFHEITKDAILKAVEKPRTLNMDRIWAQQARSMLDLMIGFTLSPILWNQVARGLSAGRCQTPALKLLIEKEQQIQSFKAASSWRLSGQWFSVSTPTKLFQANMEDELEDEESATNYLDIRRTGLQATVQTNQIKPWSSNPPEPLMTSTLQQQASALYGLSPKATMQIAQKLYEAGHITYMRTDKASLSEEATKEARALVETTWGTEFLGLLKESPPEDLKKVAAKGLKEKTGTKAPKEGEVQAQEAHEAIRPTHMDVAEVDEAGQRLYTLIRNRTLQSVMAKALGETCTVKFHMVGESEEERLPWLTQVKRTTFQGWQIVGKVASIDEEDEDLEASTTLWTQITALKPTTVLQWKQIQAHPHETKAQPRFTEATLVRALEQHGIGRPSTFASLLAAVQDRGYALITNVPGKSVEQTSYTLIDPAKPFQMKKELKILGAEKKKLVPTDLGRSCLQFLEAHFHHLFQYKFTSEMEQRLDRIEKGLEHWKKVLQDTWLSYKDTYQTMIKSPSKAGTDSAKIRVLNSEGVKAVMTKKGPLLLKEGATKDLTVFYGWPQGVPFASITEAQALAHVTSASVAKAGEQVGVWQDQPVLKKSGKFGTYVVAGTTTVSISATDSWPEIETKLNEKASKPSGILKTFKDYEIRTGAYGPYIFKPSLKTKLFASIPKDTKIEDLTEADAAMLYKASLEAKKKRFVKK
uniref:DNA topoisomerase n=1 Tax=viral metagenome TaxID=1070528 RepID=A0A6C0K0S6_9ZZZZ